jgi:hypothetical protein
MALSGNVICKQQQREYEGAINQMEKAIAESNWPGEMHGVF